MQRHIAAIMVADIVGSTASMAQDEESAVSRFSEWLATVRETVEKHSGRVFNTAGDSVLAEFPSAVNALRSAMESRSRLPSLDLFRFALHVDDVIEVENDLRGDGVNIAARLQMEAEPGDIIVSGDLYGHVKRKSPCVFEDLGFRELAGVPEPVRLFRVKAPIDRHRFQAAPTMSAKFSEIRPNSVAILPFKVASSADEDQQFLAEGLTDDLTLELSRIKSIFVASRTAAASAESADATETGRRLGVRFVLSGSIRKLGETIRLNFTLTDTVTGKLVWSDRIQRPFAEVMDVLDEITGRLAATVSGRVQHESIAAIRLKRPQDMTAYEYYLQGVDHHRLGGVTDDHVHEAIRWFEKSREIDPNYARPYAMQVCSASYLPDFSINVAEDMLATALRLDPTDPEAHRIMGVLRIKKDGDYESARFHHEKAMEMAPNDPYIMGRCAAFYTFTNEPERALELLQRAELLDPFLPVWVMEERVAALYAQNKLKEAIRAANGLPFQTRRTRIYVAACQIALGNTEAGCGAIAAALKEDPALSGDYVRSQELFADKQVLEKLIALAGEAGLPQGKGA
ncbi:MAG: tetratricopeptide repeat protein [Rhizobiaceae bacterium]